MVSPTPAPRRRRSSSSSLLGGGVWTRGTGGRCRALPPALRRSGASDSEVELSESSAVAEAGAEPAAVRGVPFRVTSGTATPSLSAFSAPAPGATPLPLCALSFARRRFRLRFAFLFLEEGCPADGVDACAPLPFWPLCGLSTAAPAPSDSSRSRSISSAMNVATASCVLVATSRHTWPMRVPMNASGDPLSASTQASSCRSFSGLPTSASVRSPPAAPAAVLERELDPRPQRPSSAVSMMNCASAMTRSTLSLACPARAVSPHLTGSPTLSAWHSLASCFFMRKSRISASLSLRKVSRMAHMYARATQGQVADPPATPGLARLFTYRASAMRGAPLPDRECSWPTGELSAAAAFHSA
mmetsp:Transcript_3070/g.8679  ORF Transcript_3070/g.8679 Transcript_3070/m.8679 type:complete len:358 (+) Transcript_3070:1419-2492(+)